MRTITVRLDEGLLAAVDAARGDVPRERWLRRAVEAALNGQVFDRVAVNAPEPEEHRGLYRSDAEIEAAVELKRTREAGRELPEAPGFVRRVGRSSEDYHRPLPDPAENFEARYGNPPAEQPVFVEDRLDPGWRAAVDRSGPSVEPPLPRVAGRMRVEGSARAEQPEFDGVPFAPPGDRLRETRPAVGNPPIQPHPHRPFRPYPKGKW